MTTILQARPRQFVNTPSIDRVAKRALRYLQSGYSVHLQGPAGTGKTTLALHLADLLTRPIMLLFGDDEFKTSDLIGNQSGFTRKKVFDNFIHSVVKMEDEVRQNWVDSRLTLACREGFTLVYDEFNRSRPEVNNVLLSALEEKLLVLPPNSSRSEYIRVSPHFRAIFTSNPAEYCGVHATQDALLDRLITINMPEPDELTQQEILVQKTEIARESAVLVVQLVKAFRQQTSAKDSSGLRSCLMIAKVAQEHSINVFPGDSDFRELCQDILLARSSKDFAESMQILWDLFNTYQSCEGVPEIAADGFSGNRFTDEPVEERLVHPELDTSAEDDAVNTGIVETGAPEEVRLGKPDPEIPLAISPSDDTLDEIFGDEESLESSDGAIAPHVIQEVLDHVESKHLNAAPVTLTSGSASDITEVQADHHHADDRPHTVENRDLWMVASEALEASGPIASEPEALEPEALEPESIGTPKAIANGSISSVTFAPGEDIPGLDDIDMALADTLEISRPSAISPGAILGDNALAPIPLDSSSRESETLDHTSLNDQPGEGTLANLFTNDRLSDAIPSVPFEREVYTYLLQSHDARPSQIEAALGISRFQTVNALRSLTSKGLIASHSSHGNGHRQGDRNSATNGHSSRDSHSYARSAPAHSSISSHIRGHIMPPHSLEMTQPRMMHGGDAV